MLLGGLGRSSLLTLWLLASPLHAETWMGLEVRPESRCSVYDRDRDYRYSQSLEPKIAKRMGGIRCRYTGQRYQSLSDTQIEHVVALSEAHDSGSLRSRARPGSASSPTTCSTSPSPIRP